MLEQLTKQLETLESNLDKKFIQQSEEIKNVGQAHESTKNEIENLREQYKDVASKLEAFETKSNRLGGNVDAGTPNFKKAFAQYVKENNVYDTFKKYNKSEFELKGVTLSGETHPATIMPGIVMAPERAVRLRSIMATSSTNSDRIYYNEETAVVDRTVMRSPSGLTSASGLSTTSTITQKSVDVKGISNVMHVTEESLKDVGFMSSYVPNKLTRLLLDAEDTQIAYGAGTQDELMGLFTNATAFDSAGFAALPTGYTTNPRIDQLRWAVKQIRSGEYRASAIMLSPEDYAIMELLKDANGNYLYPGIFTGAIPTIAGIPIFEHSEIEEGHFGVADLQRATTLFFREGITIKVYDSHDMNVKNGLVSFKITERLALTNERPSAVVYGEFTV